MAHGNANQKEENQFATLSTLMGSAALAQLTLILTYI